MANSFLTLNPSRVISFPGTEFDQTYTQTLTLTNCCDRNVAFKVKTTALRAYLVRPSASILKPGESAEVQVVLQKLTEIPANNVHKFLVLALQTDETHLLSRDSWNVLTAAKPPMQEHRLAVIFPDVNGESEKPNGMAGGMPADPTSQPGWAKKDLRTRYDELYKYSERLEQEKNMVSAAVKRAGGAAKGGSKYQLWHLVLAVILSILSVKVAEKYKLVK